MLDKSILEDEIKDALLELIPPAVKLGMMQTVPMQNPDAEETGQRVGDCIAEQLAEPFAERLAAIIDAYVKGADFSGTIITMGSPVTQTAVIVPGGMPVLNGAIPNTLKIQ